MNAIQLSNLTKYYGKSRGILNLNLDVKEGEFFGFIGPNGAGKSTTIRTLLGLITPSSGQAKIFDETIRQRNPQIHSHIGYLPSEAVFITKTVLQKERYYADACSWMSTGRSMNYLSVIEKK